MISIWMILHLILTRLADGAGLSDNPYDAQNNALAVNFNTVNLKKDQSGNSTFCRRTDSDFTING